MAQKIYRFAVFDLDGTLLNTLDDLAASVNFALGERGYPLRPLEDVRSFIGNGVENLMRLALPAPLPDTDFQRIMTLFRGHYAENMENQTAPYPGVTELLRRLKRQGVGVSIASNKYQAGVERLSETYFPGLYTAALGETETVLRKPDPAIVYAALERMGAAKDETLYIGDSEVDAATAKNAGVDFLGVSWGLRDRPVLLQSDAVGVADHAGDILPFFLRQV